MMLDNPGVSLDGGFGEYLTESGAVILILGMHAQQTQFTPMAFYLKELSIKSGLYFSWQDYKDAFKMICENKEMFLKTITSHIKADPDEIQQMFIKLFESGSNDECRAVQFRKWESGISNDNGRLGRAACVNFDRV